MISIYTKYSHLAESISVMRLPPSDQLLNTLLSSSYVCLQLSTREGFEVKVSEALHKGIPVIATKRGGIPLQIQHEKNGYLVEAGDSKAVAKHLLDLWLDDKLHKQMSEYARKSVSDEVSTAGNALAWFYLADTWLDDSKKSERLPKERWVNDLAREAAGIPYQAGENKLPRHLLE
jgi:glycosyltransferase involved in cell wall biosynthesis